MREFNDNAGRKWSIDIVTDSIKRVRETLNVDLCKLHSDESARVFGDPVLLVDVLFVLVEDEAKKRDVSDIEFGRGMIGDALEFGAMALLDAVSDFFPKSKRLLMNKIKTKGQELSDLAATQAMEMLDTLTVEQLLTRPTRPPPATPEPAPEPNPPADLVP